MRHDPDITPCHGPLSILYLRCRARFYVWSHGPTSGAFNSLFEMHRIAASAGSVVNITFNSLFEMPRHQRPVDLHPHNPFQFSI